MSRLTNAVARILSDPENRDRTAGEVAEAVIEQAGELIQAQAEKDFTARMRASLKAEIQQEMARSHRTVVVGQISLDPDWSDPRKRRTVVLGPFSVRRTPDTDEKFQEMAEGPSGAKTAGYELAWDVKTGLGRGRFMMAPVHYSARQAYDFYRKELLPLREVVEGAISTRAKGELPPLCHCKFVNPRACPQHGDK